MLRINLLPPYVKERRNGFYVFLGMVLLFGLTTPPLLLYNAMQKSSLKNEQAEADQAEAGKATTDKLKGEAATITASVAPIAAKLGFVKAVADYNIAWARIYSKMAEYSDPKITYSDAAVNGASMQIQAYTPSTADVARYLQVIYQDPDFSSVAIDRIPGWGEAFIWKYYLDGKLIGTSTAVDPTKAALPAGVGAAGGAGGGPPPGFGGGGGPPPGFGGGGGPPAGFGGGGGAAPALGTERVYTVAEVLAEKINPFATPAQKALQIQRALKRVVRKQVARGFDISVTATLVKPLSPPGMPGSPGASAGRAGGASGGRNAPSF